MRLFTGQSPKQEERLLSIGSEDAGSHRFLVQDNTPEAAAGEQEEPGTGYLTEQAPEEAAAAGERLADHIQARTGHLHPAC